MARNVANAMFGFQSLILAQSEKLIPISFNCQLAKRFYAGEVLDILTFLNPILHNLLLYILLLYCNYSYFFVKSVLCL